MNPIDISGSCFANGAAAQKAVDMALPMITAAMLDPQVCGSGFLYIVVMDPAIGPQDASFDNAVLLEHSIGDRSQWDADYAGFARDKARIAWQYGIDSHRIQASGAHRLREGDTLLWGSVCLDGIIVGASGAEAWYDEAFATCIAANLRAIAKQEWDAARKGGSLRAGSLPERAR